ncbi:hypothetical protein CPB85DRAFT_1444083 [Mucidula mucida]|nr:hypothetical protein CPB85DRAFT_1444083 [Mucidula mucida]
MHPAAALLHTYLHAASALDWDAALSCLADEVELTVMPASAGLPTMGKAQFLGAVEGSMNKWFDPGAMKFTVHEVHEVKTGNMIIAHAQSDGTSKMGTPWHNEYMFVVEVEDGKIRRFTEFLDSGFLKEFFEAEGKISGA